MKIVFSWDDGALEDLKLFKLHEKYNIPGMFFVPTKNRENRSVLTTQMIKEANPNLISFGAHTQNHTYLTSIPLDTVENEVVSNKQYLEDVLGSSIKHFCLPGGQYNGEILQILDKHFDTIRTADTMNFKNTSKLLKPSFHLYPRGKKSLIFNALKHKSFTEVSQILMHNSLSYYDLISKIIDKDSKDNDKMIIIWGHSWELEEFDLWKYVEAIFSLVSTEYSQLCVSYESLIKGSNNENC